MGALFSYFQGPVQQHTRPAGASFSSHAFWLFWSTEMEIAVLGLGNAGKSSFVHVINTGVFKENMMATVGFNMHKVQKGKVVIKVWDMGGQEKYRGMWERYCRGVEVIVFVVDANDPKLFPLAQKEMQSLLAQPTLAGVPLLVLLNKNDLPTAVDPQEVVRELQLESLVNRDVSYYSVSCKNIINIDKTLEFLVKRAGNKNKK